MNIPDHLLGALGDLYVYASFIEDVNKDLRKDFAIDFKKLEEDTDILFIQTLTYLPTFLKNLQQEELVVKAESHCLQILKLISEFTDILGARLSELRKFPGVLGYLTTLAQPELYTDVLTVLYKSRIAKLLIERRKTNNIDQEHLSEVMQMTAESIKLLESGSNGIPSNEQAEKLDRVLGISDPNKGIVSLVNEYNSLKNKPPKIIREGKLPRIGILT
jgi:transcriptional regulator with XRE-family HTH domain